MEARRQLIAHLDLIAVAILLGTFAAAFDAEANSWPVNFTWFAAMAAWCWALRRRDAGRELRRPRLREHWPFCVALVIFGAAWLPFFDNWRFVASGDTLPWFQMPYEAATQRLAGSILSIRGIWNHFTYTQVLADNFLMFIFEPSFFWHRASKLATSILSLIAIYTYFSLVLRRPWALAVVLVTATNFIWLIFSYISYNHIDSYLFAYLTLGGVVLVVHQPERMMWWGWTGCAAGLSLFLTQTAWAEVTAAGLFIAVWAAVRRHWRGLIFCGASFLVAGLPVLLQLDDLIRFNFTLHAGSSWDWPYLWRIFRAIFWLPYGQGAETVDMYRHFFFRPWGQLYLAGFAIGAAALVPAVRRALSLPVAAGALALLLLWDAALLSVTNYGFPAPSVKRSYHLIPLQAFFCLLPLYALAGMVRRWTLAPRLVTGAAFIAIATYAHANLSLFNSLSRFGGTIVDGSVQLHQRFKGEKVLFLDPRPEVKRFIENPDSLLNVMYGVFETVSVTASPEDGQVTAVCTPHGILCRFNKQNEGLPASVLERAVEDGDVQLSEMDLWGVPELDCFRCSPHREARESEGQASVKFPLR